MLDAWFLGSVLQMYIVMPNIAQAKMPKFFTVDSDEACRSGTVGVVFLKMYLLLNLSKKETNRESKPK